MTNRPLVGSAPTERYNVSLPPDVAEALRKAGGGNLSAGIRLAAAMLARKTAGKKWRPNGPGEPGR
jgi:hypothetical protein